jgi:hypothetical protein
MPSLSELLGILVVIIVIWIVLKVARVAIRLMFLFIGLLIVIGVVYYVFLR